MHIFFIPFSMTLATILFWNCLLPSKRKEATWKQPFLLPNMYIAQYHYYLTLIAYEKVYLTFNEYIWPNMFEMLFHFRRNCTKVTQKSSQVWNLNPCYIVAPRWFSNYQHVKLLLCQNHHKFQNNSNLVYHVMTYQEKALGGIGIRYPLCISKPQSYKHPTI